MKKKKKKDQDDIFHKLACYGQLEVKSASDSLSKQRFFCFAYSLQLIIKDGIKETRSLCGSLPKSSRILHSGTEALFL